jgi:hypothetical protein
VPSNGYPYRDSHYFILERALGYPAHQRYTDVGAGHTQQDHRVSTLAVRQPTHQRLHGLANEERGHDGSGRGHILVQGQQYSRQDAWQEICRAVIQKMQPR